MYYIYELIDPRNNEVFYVGKGSNDRMYDHVKEVKRGNVIDDNKKKYYKIKKILSEGCDDVIYRQVYFTHDEQHAYDVEEQFQKMYGLENLCNVCIGGIPPNVKGIHRSEETKRKMGESKKGEKHPFYGKYQTKESNEKRSISLKGKSYEEKYGIEKSNEIKKKKSELLKGNNNYMYGKHHTEKAKEKIRLANSKSYEERYGEKRAKEIKRKKSISLLGHIHSEETRKRISISRKGQTSYRKGKTWEEIYGVEKAEKMRRERREKK